MIWVVKGKSMARKRHGAEQIVRKLREAEVDLARGATVAVSTGVLPVLREYLGPRTAWAGFSCRTWPVTSQSNRTRSAARCCLTVAGASWPWSIQCSWGASGGILIRV